MRTPIKLFIRGFLGYLHPTELDLTNSYYFVLGENRCFPEVASTNGTGKSALLNAISWVLYGKTVDGEELSIADVKHTMAKKAEVIIFFDDGVEIHRQAGTSTKLEYRLKSHEEWISGDVREIQRQVEDRILGINWRTFMATCVFSAKATTIQFLRAEPKKRSELLSQLVDDLLFQRAARTMKADVLADTAKFSELTTLSNYQEGEINKAQEALARLRAHYHTESTRAQSSQVSLNKELVAVKEQLRTLKELLSSPPPTLSPQAQIEGEVSKVQTLLNTLINKDLMEAMSKCTNNMHWAAGDRCLQCGRVVTAQQAQEMRQAEQEANREVQSIQAQIRALEVQKMTLQESLSLNSQYRIQLQSWQREYAAVNNRYVYLQDQLSKDPLKDLRQRIQDMEKDIQTRATELASSRTQQQALSIKINTLETLIPGFTTDIKNLLFDAIRVELEGLTYRYTEQFARGMFQILYPNTTTTNREKFEIQVIRRGRKRDFSTYSGGEAWRASCIALLALRQVMLNQSLSQINMLLIDDPIGELDDVGRDKFFEIISQIQAMEKNLVMATTPLNKPPVVANARIIKVIFESEVSRLA